MAADSCQANETVAIVAPNPTFRRTVFGVVLTAPYAYLGLLLAVLIHEVVGHGLVALALGGNFEGFRLKLDGMGWATAYMPQNAPEWKTDAVLLGGVVSTTAVGIVALVLGRRFRSRPWLALPLLAVALNLLLEGPPYAFWNAVHAVPPGDIGRVAADNALLRALIIACAGVIMIGSIWAITALLLEIVEGWITSGRRLEGTSRVVTLLILTAVPGAMWFIFDWNQLAPGIGLLPNVVGLVLHLATAAILYYRAGPTRAVADSRSAMVASILAGWLVLGAFVSVTQIWLRHGIEW